MRKTSKDIYEQLRQEIVSGRIVAGATLVESTIAARYNVSRTPVREALRRLEQDDLVEQRDRGLVVRSRSPEEILEIYSVRVVLEGLAARTAAEARTELDLANLADRNARMLTVDDKDPDAMAAANQLFHQALWASSHNRTLVDMLVRINSHLLRYPATTLASPGRWETVLKDHQRLIDAITARDAETAGSIAETHMAAARDIKLRIFASEET